VPTPQPVKFVSSDFNVQIAHGNGVRKGCHFILRRQHNACFADGFGEPKLFQLRKPLGQPEFLVAVDARLRDRFIE